MSTDNTTAAEISAGAAPRRANRSRRYRNQIRALAEENETLEALTIQLLDIIDQTTQANLSPAQRQHYRTIAANVRIELPAPLPAFEKT